MNILECTERRKTKSNFPPELVGKWRSGGYEFIFTQEGYMLVVNKPLDWSISPDGQTLTKNSAVFSRTGGSGTSIIGVWRCGDEEWHFRDDATYSGHWYGDDSFDFNGLYEIEGSKIVISEYRGEFIVDGNTIIISPPWGPDYPGTYVLDGDTFTTIISGYTQVYTRI
jgi:hypothetical protein